MLLNLNKTFGGVWVTRDSKTFKLGVDGSGSLILRGNALRMIFLI